MTKTLSAYSGAMPIPLSVQHELPELLALRRTPMCIRGGVVPRNFTAFANQVLEHLGQQ